MRLVKGLLERCIQVVELMAASTAPCRLSELAAVLEIPKSATHRLLSELQALGWVEQQGSDGPYRLTLRFALLGHRVLAASGLPGAVQPVLQALAEQARELARLTVNTSDGLAWFATAQGASAGLLYQPRMDEKVRLHTTANGKAFLASFDDEVALHLAQNDGLGDIRPTSHTLSTAEALLADLRRVRRRGYAIAKGEAETGVTAVAVSVRGPEGVLGTVSVAGPAVRINGREEALAAMLHEAARTLGSLWPTTHIPPGEVA